MKNPMDNEVPKPPNAGYNLSTDYGNLWELIAAGHRIPCWVLHENRWNIANVRSHDGVGWSIGSPGCGWESTYRMTFAENCTELNLHYIVPNGR